MLGLPVWLKIVIVFYLGFTIATTIVIGIDEGFWNALKFSQIVTVILACVFLLCLGLIGLYSYVL